MSGSVRETFERWFDALTRKDHNALAAMLHPDYVDEMPQSGERTRGAANMRAIVENYPGTDDDFVAIENPELFGAEDRWAIGPNFTVVQVTGQGDDYTVTGRARYPDGQLWYIIVLATMKDGLFHRTTTYYAPELPAPDWRAQWVEPME